MITNNFSDADLILFGHGSSGSAEAGAPVVLQAAELRRQKKFARVYEGFWKQDPRVQDVLRKAGAPRVFLVPMFISEGYFSEGIIPRALGFPDAGRSQTQRVLRRPEQLVFYCRPIGTHPRMTEVLVARARKVVEQFPFPKAPRPKDTTLFIAGHGTEQHEESRGAVEQQVKRIRAMGIYAAVHGIFLEENPKIASCYQTARTRNIVIVPFFISDGLHSSEDIPLLLGEPRKVVEERRVAGQPTWRNPTEKQGKLVWYAPSIGAEPSLGEIILARVVEAAAWVETAEPGKAPHQLGSRARANRSRKQST